MRLPRIEISAGAYLGAALAVLMLPINWLAGWLIAVTVHECGHITAMWLCHIPIREIEIGPFGAKISAPELTPKQELMCAAAGPMCSFLLIVTAGWFPAAALIGTVQGLYNLLPVYPLDGGRIARAILFVIREKWDGRKIPCKDRYLRVQ